MKTEPMQDPRLEQRLTAEVDQLLDTLDHLIRKPASEATTAAATALERLFDQVEEQQKSLYLSMHKK